MTQYVKSHYHTHGDYQKCHLLVGMSPKAFAAQQNLSSFILQMLAFPHRLINIKY